MNGKDLTEALSFIDESYIAEAETAGKVRRIRWQPMAALAACLALVLIGYRNLPMLTGKNAMQMAVYESASSDTAAVNGMLQAEEKRSAITEEAEMDTAMMPMMISAWTEMSVKFQSFEDDVAVCVVTDPGTSGLEVGTEVRIRAELPMEKYEGTVSYAESPVFRILYEPEEMQDGVIIPVSVTEEE